MTQYGAMEVDRFLARVMAIRLDGARPLLNKDSTIFCKNAFENAICKMTAILSAYIFEQT